MFFSFNFSIKCSDNYLDKSTQLKFKKIIANEVYILLNRNFKIDLYYGPKKTQIDDIDVDTSDKNNIIAKNSAMFKKIKIKINKKECLIDSILGTEKCLLSDFFSSLIENKNDKTQIFYIIDRYCNIFYGDTNKIKCSIDSLGTIFEFFISNKKINRIDIFEKNVLQAKITIK